MESGRKTVYCFQDEDGQEVNLTVPMRHRTASSSPSIRSLIIVFSILAVVAAGLLLFWATIAQIVLRYLL